MVKDIKHQHLRVCKCRLAQGPLGRTLKKNLGVLLVGILNVKRAIGRASQKITRSKQHSHIITITSMKVVLEEKERRQEILGKQSMSEKKTKN